MPLPAIVVITSEHCSHGPYSPWLVVPLALVVAVVAAYCLYVVVDTLRG